MSEGKKGCCLIKILNFIIFVAILCAFFVEVVLPRLDSEEASSTGISVDNHLTVISEMYDGKKSKCKYWVNDKCCTYYYNQLSGTEKSIYKAIVFALANGENKITMQADDFKNTSYECKRALYAAYMEHPEFFWLNRGHICSQKGENITLTFYTEKFYDYIDAAAYQNKLKKAVISVAENAPNGSDYDKVKYIHDYLIENAVYDYDGLEAVDNNIAEPATELMYTAYGCLINGKCVCNGFALAASLLLNYMGVEGMWVSGDAGGSHAWNILKLDGNYYYFDITWDNLDDGKYNNEPFYTYFGLTEKEMSNDHTVNKELFDVPDCVDNYYNYFVYNSFCFDNYDVSAISAAIRAQSGQTVCCFSFSNEEAYNEACEGLFTDNDYVYVVDSKKYNVSYRLYDSLYVVYIFLNEK